jgi:hypothetical protein
MLGDLVTVTLGDLVTVAVAYLTEDQPVRRNKNLGGNLHNHYLPRMQTKGFVTE